MSTFRQCLVTLLVCLLASLPAGAQQAPSPQRLRVIALEGQNAVNYIPSRSATAPVVEVRDENDRPVEGAKVVFTITPVGPGATFEGQSTQSTTTDFRGQAGTNGYTINDKTGRFNIDVTATYLGRTGRITIMQTNSVNELPAELGGVKRSGKKKWILLGLAAGVGAGLGIYFGTRGTNGPISVGIGPVTVAGPQ